MKPTKILFLTADLRSGGKERQLVELLKALSVRKEFICELAVMAREIHYDAIKQLNINVHYMIRETRRDPKMFIHMYNVCKKIQPDIIHTWDSMTSIYAAPAAKKLGVKLINGMIRDAPPKMKIFRQDWTRSKLTFPFSDLIVSNSYAGLKSYKAPAGKSCCIHNGFDFNRINLLEDKNSIRNKHEILTDNIIGMVASFSVNKDYPTYIKAALMVLEKRDDVTFLAIGNGLNLEKYKTYVKSKYKRKIKFLGRQQDVESLINLFNIGVLATNTSVHGEGISNSVREYMALGKPVVATECDGTRELVLDGKTGFLVPTGDTEIMCMRLNQLLEDKKLPAKMGNAGKERIYNNFSLNKMAESYINLYDKVLSSAR